MTVPNHISEKGFDLLNFKREQVYEKPSAQIDPMQAFMADKEVWANYEDKELADIERALRKWALAMAETPAWKTDRKGRHRRYATSMVFECLYGKPYTKDYYKTAVKLSTLLRYYASKVQKGGTINNKRYTHTIYTLSIDRFRKRPPFSVRLRLEWLEERNRSLTVRRMQVYTDELLEAGHARAAKAEANMQEHARKGRESYERWLNSKDSQSV